ncbi:MAG: response regulator transcription factor [Chloroflexaceae bacterium]|jgi:two-component system KDP operon response regulator KdpE|nr:response regulator transcription factor [Chloroflexaceae bacterium]
MSPRLLVVDDEPQIGRMLRTVLTAHGYTVQVVNDGQAAVETVATWRPDLVILDLGLPGLDGFEVSKRVREWSQVPIIVLTVRDAEQDKVKALDLGADDYLTKPFGTDELLARIRVALRHAARLQRAEEPLLQFGELQIDRGRRLVTLRGQEVRLTPTEYDLLVLLAGNAGKVLTHRTILRAIWGPASEQDVPTLRVFVTQLRRKIEPDPAHPIYIGTEPGVGYRFHPGTG